MYQRKYVISGFYESRFLVAIGFADTEGVSLGEE